MKNWLKQKTTIVGIISLCTTGLQGYQSGGDVATIILGILSAAMLWVKSEDFLSGLCCVVGIGGILFSTGCGASLSDLNISDKQKLEIAIEAGCAAAASSGCFDDEDIENIIGDVSTSDECVEYVSSISGQILSVDPGAITDFTSKIFTCNRFKSAIEYLKSI